MEAAALTAFLLSLLAAGVPTVELIRVEPVLAHAGHLLSAAFCQRVRRLLLPTPGRGRLPSSEEISA
jgi:hypothetical protein